MGEREFRKINFREGNTKMFINMMEARPPTGNRGIAGHAEHTYNPSTWMPRWEGQECKVILSYLMSVRLA